MEVPRTIPPASPDTTRTWREPPDARRWHLALHVEASVAGGAAPSVLFGTPVSVEAIAPATGVLAPTFHLGFERASAGTLDTAGPTALFTLTTGIVDACPNRWRVLTLSFEPCLRVEAGTLEGAGGNVVPAHDLTRGWAAVGPVARAEWAFFKTVFLDVESGVRFPLVRTTYFVLPDTTIYPVPSVAGVVQGGLGVRFL
jgi:hypothetical protein